MKEEKLIAENTARLNITKIVGYYGISKRSNEINYTHEVQIYFTKKPNWFHRMMTKILLGWEWFDEKN